ncbi:MAG: hypothetical protein JXR76_12955 [Deltaproteobacteria bacterium]|nr:hypothetical protein [Deltaproteobacteria bacterium]
MATRNMTEHVKIGLAAGAMALTLLAFVIARLKVRAQKNAAAREFLEKTTVLRMGKYTLNAFQSFVAALIIVAAVGTLNYNRYSTDLIENGYDEYDLLHYYINAKYFDELGYFRLLPALIAASDEAGPWCTKGTSIYLAQDEEDYQLKPIRDALAQKDAVKSHFTQTRWEQFVHDATFIQRKSKRLRCNLWQQLLQDHGFNGSPTWVLIARPITQVIPVESIKMATLLDLVLIIAMLGLVLWAFGGQAFAFAWLFITISYSFRWPTITWVLLRYDWLTCIVTGICFIKKKKPITAGAFFGYATLMRYFPALWLFGIAAKGVHALITNRNIPLSRFWLRVPIPYYKMAAGFFGIMLFLLPISFAVDGVAAHKKSLENLTAHVEPHNLSSMRQGLAVALTWRGETEQYRLNEEKKDIVAEWEGPLRKISIAFLIVLGLFMSRLKDWEAVGLGVIPYFFLTTSSYYYYSMRLTAVVIHAADLSKRRNVVGLIILFGIELFCHASENLDKGNRYFLISIMGLMLLGYALTMYGFLGYEWWTTRKKLKSDTDNAQREALPASPDSAPETKEDSEADIVNTEEVAAVAGKVIRASEPAPKDTKAATTESASTEAAQKNTAPKKGSTPANKKKKSKKKKRK